MGLSSMHEGTSVGVGVDEVVSSVSVRCFLEGEGDSDEALHFCGFEEGSLVKEFDASVFVRGWEMVVSLAEDMVVKVLANLGLAGVGAHE
jgi:hypothetical protein